MAGYTDSKKKNSEKQRDGRTFEEKCVWVYGFEEEEEKKVRHEETAELSRKNVSGYTDSKKKKKKK